MLGLDILQCRRPTGHVERSKESISLGVFSKQFWQTSRSVLDGPKKSNHVISHANPESIVKERPVEDVKTTPDSLYLRDTSTLKRHRGDLRSCLLVPKANGSTEKVPIQKSKSVHFADSRGMSLTSVLTVFDGEDDYGLLRACFASPSKSYSCLQQKNYRQRWPAESQRSNRLVNFTQPVATANFQERVAANNISLENVTFRDCSLFGTAVVQNLDFDKNVFVRFTTDAWRTTQDLQAAYTSGSCRGNTDTFSFEISLPKINGDVHVEFCLCYEVLGECYWDNNDGKNYKVTAQGNVSLSKTEAKNHFLLDLTQRNMCNWIL